MQFREVTYRQQLAIQRLVHGPEADISERRCVSCCCLSYATDLHSVTSSRNC